MRRQRVLSATGTGVPHLQPQNHRSMPHMPVKDGLYRVVHKNFVAGFVVVDGKVKRSQCAPILRKKLAYWVKSAVWICE